MILNRVTLLILLLDSMQLIILDATHLSSRRFKKNDDKESSCTCGATTAFKRTRKFCFFKIVIVREQSRKFYVIPVFLKSNGYSFHLMSCTSILHIESCCTSILQCPAAKNHLNFVGILPSK